MWEEGAHCKIPEKSSFEILAEQKGVLETKDAQIWFANFCKSNLYFTVKLLTGIEIDLYQEIKLIGFLLRDFAVNIEGRGIGKSFTVSIFIVLYALFNPGVKIGICSGTFRQSKLIFKQIEKFKDHAKGKFLAQCIGKIGHDPDGYTMDFTNGSHIMAVPLTEKIRGLRFHKVIIDEYLLVPKEIIETVISPFMTARHSTAETDKIRRMEDELIQKGLMKESERKKVQNNSLMALSSASFKFEDLYKNVFNPYRQSIIDPNQKDVSHFVFRISYEAVEGYGRLDMKFINNMKLSTSKAHFDKEYRAIFGDEGAGYFSWASLEAATVPMDTAPMIKVRGDNDKKYLLAIDPNYSESETADHFAMALLELNEEEKSGTLVHAYALSSGKISKRSEYLNYLLTHFNIVYIIVDNSGGPKFISDAEQFLSGFPKGPILPLEDTFLDGEEGIKAARRNYNLAAGRIMHSQVFGKGNWINLANETLQYHIEHQRIKFGGRLGDRGLEIISGQEIPIASLEFDSDEYEDLEEKQFAFGDHLNELVELTKKELTLIEVSSNMSGNNTFDLAKEVKGSKKDPTRARRDSYTALLLASYGMACYWKIMETSLQEDIIMPQWIG